MASPPWWFAREIAQNLFDGLQRVVVVIGGDLIGERLKPGAVRENGGRRLRSGWCLHLQTCGRLKQRCLSPGSSLNGFPQDAKQTVLLDGFGDIIVHPGLSCRAMTASLHVSSTSILYRAKAISLALRSKEIVLPCLGPVPEESKPTETRKSFRRGPGAPSWPLARCNALPAGNPGRRRADRRCGPHRHSSGQDGRKASIGRA